MRIIAALLMAVVLAGCSHTPLSSMYALRNFDPQETDFDRLRIAIELPPAYRVPPGGVRMVMTGSRQGAPAIDETFALIRSEAEEEEVAALQKPEHVIHVYRIAPTDIARLNATRAALKEAGEGDLEIQTDTCRESESMPDSLPVTTYVKSEETDRFVPVFVDVDLLAQAEAGSDVLPVCDT